MQSSRVARNDVAGIARTTGLGVDGICARTGLAPELVRQLHDDPRALPPPTAIYVMCLGLGLPIEAVVKHDPDGASPSELLGVEGPLRVTVCGAGNLGHVFVGYLGARSDVHVDLLTSSKEKAEALSRAIDAAGGVHVKSRDGEVVGRPGRVSADPAEVIPGAHVVLLALPSFCEREVLERIAPHLDDGALLGSIPGPGGFQWAAAEVLRAAGKRATVFGMASIPWMCKLEESGRAVRVLGRKSISGIATPDRANAHRVCDVMQSLVEFPIIDIGNFLQVIFNPGNQLLHPGLVYDMFRDWDGKPLPEAPLFYEGATDAGAAIVAAMGSEILEIRRAIERERPDFDLSGVLPVDLAIRAAYGADIVDDASLGAILRSNRAYAGIRTPMLAVPGGVVPNFGSRFFLEDIPYGLVVIKGVAELAGVATKAIDEVVTWCQAKMGKEYIVDGRLVGRDVGESGAPQRYGITSLRELLDAESGVAKSG